MKMKFLFPGCFIALIVVSFLCAVSAFGTDTIIAQYCIPGNAIGNGSNPDIGLAGKAFSLGIAFSMIASIASTSAVFANDISLTVRYK